MRTRVELERRGLEQVLSAYAFAEDSDGVIVELSASIGIVYIDSAEQVAQKLRILADALEDAEKNIQKH